MSVVEPEDRGLNAIADDVAAVFKRSLGFPSAAGRIFACLLVSDTPMSQSDLRAALSVSEGSVSEGLRLLQNQGLVERASPPRQRPAYFGIRPDAWEMCAQHTLSTVLDMRDLAASSLARVGGRNSPARARLMRMHRMYDVLARELPSMLERAVAEDADN